MPCYSPLKGWKDRDTGGIVFRRSDGSAKMEVSCGQCLGCRLDHSRMWAMRIVHEASLYEYTGGNCFITLTYDDENIPDDWSLDKSHFQKFMKRLRKFYGKERIRFFHCGEYGNTCKHGIDLELVGCPLCNVGRPHYHACLFNCSFPDLVPYESDGDRTRFTSATLERIWGKGFVDVSELTFESAAYVARYIMKKITGIRADDWYLQYDMDGIVTWVLPEYITMSRRPGLGKDWFDEFGDDVFPSDEVPVPGSGVFKKVPRFYEDLYARLDKDGMEEIHKMRELFMSLHKDEYTPEKLMMKYKVKKAQVERLIKRK